ncbi:MAG: tRNA uridine-5-carboxymethylaminomethyl(34) synthesis GTPase MnmE [Bdellovibrionales bacterium]|nr:tRNA uridine-5-carboxymethylaminomethyl(34) synthesis GTPase MnmE [Bdellovibrionales bacterium]
MAVPPPRERDHSGYLSTDTISAVSSALGGAIAVVRLSGPEAGRIAAEAHAPGDLLENPRTVCRCVLRDELGQVLDDAVAIGFRAPASYTGEDLVEFHIHGSAVIAENLLETLLRLGARQALPGEFSFRAVRNGKLSLDQAEAVGDLLNATNASATRVALEKLGGAQGRWVAEFGRELRSLAAFGEVGIDFSDQDVEEVRLPGLKERLKPLLGRVCELEGSYDRGRRIQGGVGVAILGRPNAGKSSLFNALLGEERSIVTEIAGTTRDVVRERVTLRDEAGRTVTFRLEDTAGLRIAEDKAEALGVKRSEEAARDADLVLWVVDATAELTLPPEWTALGLDHDRMICVLNKADLVSPVEANEWVDLLEGGGGKRVHLVSSVTGAGVSDLARVMANRGMSWVSRREGEVVLTRASHLQSVKEARGHLERAAQASELDLFAADVRQALASLSPLVGDTVPDDILGQIFSEFCIGK